MKQKVPRIKEISKMFIQMNRRIFSLTSALQQFIQMKQQKQQPLYFFAPGQQNLEKTLGRKQPLNPYKLIPQISSNNSNTQVTHQAKGQFYNDHLIPDEGIKLKGIKKTQKRKNYKTKMCPHGRQCRHKFSCTFAHNQSELRKPFLKRNKPCKMYQLGQCQLGSACRQYHGNIDLIKKNYKYKTEYCKEFLETGKCVKGVVCIYIHELPPQQEHSQTIQQQQYDIQQEMQKKNEVQIAKPNESKKEQAVQNQPQKQGKQIVEVIEEKIGKQQVLEDGLSFNFSF